jgi:RNA polymerase sigma-70 factor, ECF subfamily
MPLEIGLPPPAERPSRPSNEGDGWLGQFHLGAQSAIESCYRDHVGRVDRAVGSILDGADRETVVHDVFFRLMTNERLRLAFQGGSFGAWIATVARNQAIDYRRRRRLETPMGSSGDMPDDIESATTIDSRVEARLMVERFRAECLPEKWEKVFQTRFVEQVDQSEAARRLGVSRTTLIYQEFRVRTLLRRFFLEEVQP